MCSPDTRACLTTSWAFSRYPGIKGGWRDFKRRVIPWDGLGDCPSKDDYPLDPKKLPKLHRGQRENSVSAVREKLEGSNEFYTVEGKMPVRPCWEKRVETENQRMERADQARLDLYNIAKIPCSGGTWKDIVPIYSCKETESGDQHIVIVSHSNFLNLLTHREDLPGKLSTSLVYTRTNVH